MRHRESGRKLNRNSSHRKAMFRSMAVSLIEHEMIKRCLEKFKGNRRKTAQALNISERTLYRKIKEYDI